MVAALAFVAIAAASCGSDDDGSSATTAAPVGSSATTEPTSAVTHPGQTASCTLPSEPITDANQCKFAGRTLRVSTSPGQLLTLTQAGVGKLFEETTGARIEWVETQPDQMLTQLISSGQPLVDVVNNMYVPTIYTAATAGVFETYPEAAWRAVPNLKDLPEAAFSLDGFGPSAYYFLVAPCFNTKVLADSSIPVPKSWDEMISTPNLRIGFPLPENARWNLTMASLADAYGVPMTNPQPVMDRLKALGNRLVLFGGTADADQLLQKNEVGALVHTDGRCNSLKAGGTPVVMGSFGFEVDGKTYEVISSGTSPQIVKGSKNVDLAIAFINTEFTKDALLPLVSELVYNATKASVVDAMKADPKVAEFVRTDLSTVYDSKNMGTFMENRSKWVDAWNRTFQ